MKHPLQALLVEDSDDDALLFERELKKASRAARIERVCTTVDLRTALLRQAWDLIVADYNLPGFSGADALALVRDLGLDTPFIFVSGSIGEEVAVAALKAGANDYVIKGNLTRLVPAIERELRDAEGRRARKAAETALLASERRLRSVFDTALDAIVVINAEGRITSWNRQAEEVFGWPRSEVAGQLLAEVIIPPAQRQAHQDGLARFRETRTGPLLGRRIEVLALHHDGHEFPIELAISAIPLGDSWEFSAFIRDLTAQRRAEAARRDAEASYVSLVDHAPVGIFQSTVDGRFISANRALVRMLGYDSREQVLALDLAREVYADPTERERIITQGDRTRDYAEFETRWRRRDGHALSVQLSSRAVRGSDGYVGHFETVVRDVTKQRELEKQLGAAQRMEAIGRLAGGVAHDFNNLLTVILSHAELMLEDLAGAHPYREDLGEIRKAGIAAASLTRQLLAFSRQQVLKPVPLDLNDVVAGTEKMLGRLIGEDLALTTTLAPGLPPIKADPGQVEQVLLNLAANARDAMPGGGRLMIETRAVQLDEAFARDHPPTRVGAYVRLAVSDTGVGMDAETQAHIFEPFFTTKEPGKGTGLGLATVYGIVKQSDGFIWVESAPGRGTAFHIYLPVVSERPAVISDRAARPASPGGSETILLVEDVAGVREVTRRVLERLGYEVLVAADAAAAERIGVDHSGEIHLVVTDVILPDRNGPHVATAIRQVRPGTRVLFVSGYTDRAAVETTIWSGDAAFLQKPFTPDQIGRKVREVLDAGLGGTAARAQPRT
jgi:PAS domain S-box-containing protein